MSKKKEQDDILVKVQVVETTDNSEDLMGYDLKAEWCECKKAEFLCYPEDGVCTCGIEHHHVHCTCGGVMQMG